MLMNVSNVKKSNTVMLNSLYTYQCTYFMTSLDQERV